MSDKVQKALRERAAKKRDEEQKEKYSFYKESRDRVDKALEDRKTRIQSNVGSIASDILGRYESAVSSYDSYLSQNSSLASGTYSEGINFKSVLDDQRERSLAVSKLIRDIEAHRSYLGDEITDKALTGLKGMSEGYEHIRTKAELFSKYKTEDEYNADVEEWNNYYNKWGHYADAEDFETTSSNRNFVNPTDDDFAYYDAMMNYDSWRTDANGKMYDAFGNEIPYVADDKGNIIHPMQNDSQFAVSDPLGLFLSTSEDERENLVYGTQYGKKFETLREGVANHWEMLEDDEVALYYSILNKKGQDEALKYLRDTAEMLNSRWGALRAKEIQNIDNGFIKTLSTGMLGLEAGLDQWSTGVAQIIEGEALPTSGVQYASAEMSNSLNGLGKYAYNATVTVGNMLPSILTSKLLGMAGVGAKLAQGVGAVTVGASAGGNAYGQALKEGYGESQAQTYGVLVGASEAALQYLIGGIGSLGGVTDDLLLAKTKMIDSSLLRLSSKFGIKLGSEVVEEELQNFLEPAFRTILFGEDYDAPTIDEIVETAIVTALSTGVLEGGSTIAADVAENRQLIGQGKDIMKAEGGVDALREIALDMVKNSSAKTGSNIAKLSEKVSGENVKAGNVGRLYQATKDAATEQNKADIVKSLERKGYTSKEADTIADILVTQYTGENITQKQFKKVESLESEGKIRKTIEDVVLNDASTAGQRSGNINLFDYGVANGVGISTNVSTTQKNIDNKALKNEAAKVLKEKEIEVADDGKTTNLKTHMAVEVKNIANISESGEINLTIDDGMVVKASDLSFGSEAEAVFVANIGNIKLGKKPISTASANAMYQAAMTALKTNPNMTATEAMSLIKGLEESYTYGAYNFGESNLTKSESVAFASELTEEQRKFAYELGSQDRVSEVERDQKAIDELKEKGKPSKKSLGKIIFEKGAEVDESTLTATQKANLNGIKLLADISSVEFHVFKSDKVGKTFKYTMPDGTVSSANGWFVAGTNEIWIDLNAGNAGEGTMIRTAAHEISHYIKQWSPVKWKAMADLLMAEFAKNGVDTESMLNKQKAKIKRRYTKRNMPSEAKLLDMAYEELVCDALSDMLTDGSIVNFMAEVKAKDRTLWQKIGDAIKSLLKKWGLIIEDYKGRELDTDEAQALAQLEDTFKKLQAMFQEAFMDANEAVATIGARNLADFAEAKNTEGESLFQYRAMEADEAVYRDMLRKWGKMNDTQISNLFTTIDKAMDIIKDNLEVLDYAWESDIDDRAFSPVKPNSDSLYQVSLDFSTLCRKRILQQTIQAQLQEALNQPLTREEGIAICDALMALQEEGRQIEVACALCYVESARMKSPTQIKKFLNNREAVLKDFFAGKSGGSMKDKIKQAEADAREKLHKENPNGIKGKVGTMLDPRTASLKAMPKKYADAIRDAKKGAKESYKPTAEEQRLIDVAKDMTVSDFTSPEGLENLAKNYPALFDAYTSYVRNATKSKGIEGDTWWRAGDSQKIGDVLIANMNRENGLRSQSWSDFQVIHILDYIAATIELSTRNAKEQAYSKVPDYVELMGQTGVMINMSLIPTRKFNGKLDYDSVEGMAYKRALELREKYPATAGTICIGIDNKQIQMLLADSTIDYVIPYHKSGMAASIRKLMHIPTWSQYEEYQSEKNLSRSDAEAQAKKYGVKLLAESDPNYHKHTSFSEWFNLKEAKQITKMENANPTNKAMQKEYGVMYGGYMAMQNAANNYLKLCAERGIAPKFSHENADFTAEDNYWKLLIDRKMVNNATGEIIEQQTIQPIFDEGEVLRILNDELERYPSVKADQDYATRKVTEKFLSGEIKSGMSAEAIAKVMKTPVDNITKTNILASAKGETMLSERDTADYDHRIPYTHRADQFSYETFTSKPDMKVTSLGGKIPTNRADVVYQAKKNAASVGKVNKNGSVSVYVDDVGTDVVLATHGLSHGLRRINRSQTDPNFIVTLKAGEIIKNSIKINEFLPSKENASGSYVLIGVAKNTNGDVYIVRSVVNQFNNELDSVDILYAINAKKEELAATKSPRLTAKPLSVTSSTISISDLLNYVNKYFPDILPEDVLRHYKHEKRPTGDFSESVLFSDRDLAPTFYSQMGKVIEGVKQEKLAANSVVNMLRGKGVKAEEIRWSGIVPFLEGKKSVTKQELLDFINGSMLQIGEQEIAGSERQERWDEFYRQMKDVIPYFSVEEIEEMCFDYDGEFSAEKFKSELQGYVEDETISEDDFDEAVEYAEDMESDLNSTTTRWSQYKLDGGTNYRELVFTMPNSTYTNRAMKGHWGQDAEGILVHARIQDFDVNGKKMLFIEEIQSDWHNEGHSKGYSTKEYKDAVEVHDKLYNKYKKLDLAFHKYVRSNDFMTDPEDVRKKKSDWLRGKAETAQKKYLDAEKAVNSLKEKGAGDTPNAPFKDTYHEFVLKRLLRMAAEQGYDGIGWTPADIQSDRWSEDYAEGYRIEYDQEMPKFLRKYGRQWGAKVGSTVLDDDTEVWSMDIPDSMKESVLYEGQVMFSERVTDEETLDFLNEQINSGEYITVYRSFQVIDGGLYAPMNSVDRDEDGKNKRLGYRSEIGQWEKATESRAIAQRYMDTHPDAPYAKFDLDGGDNKTGGVAYNPYLHASNLVLNDQFAAAYRRNLVTVECRVPLSEAEGAYKADYAKDGTGWANWKAGGVAGQLKKIKPEFERKLFLSRYMLPVKILSDAEVAQMYKDYLDGTDISVPWNVVTPSLRKELEKVGVNISYKDVKRSNGPLKFEEQFPEEVSKILYSERDTSNRTILANALEGVAQNDIEKNKLKEYKEKIDLINAEEKRLSEIQQQLFTKGGVEPENRKALQFEAKQIANRINTYDRQLLRLEAAKPLQDVLTREKEMARKRQKQKDAEAMRDYKEKVAKTTRELMTRHQESRKKAIEGRERTAMRHKIQKVVGELNQLLLRGTKDKHVMVGLQKAVAEALDAVNMDTVGAEERVAKYNALIANAKDPDIIASLTATRDRIQEQGDKMSDKLTKLKNAYNDIKNSDDPLIANSYDEVIASRLEYIAEKVGNTPLRDMSLEQLEDVYDMYKMVLTTIRNSNKAFKSAKNESIATLGNRVMMEVEEVGGKKKFRMAGTEGIEKFTWNNLKPIYAFSRIGSNTLTDVFNNVRAGEDTWAVDVTEAREYYLEQSKKHNYDSWDFKKRYEFTSSSGMNFELSLEQIMSLYAYSKREQAAEHLRKGGIVFDETTEVTIKNKLGIPMKFNPTEATAYNLSVETLADIVGKLTDEQRAFVDEMQSYLSTEMGEKGNEVSLEMYGVKLFKEKNYFPLKSATQFMAKAKEQQQGEVKIKNSGFSKETVQKANNPIVLTPFMDVWANHVNEMSMYHSFVLPMEDFYRVFNYKTPTSDTMATESVEMFIQNAYGKGATQYIEQLLKDLNGGAISDPRETFSKALMSKFKKAAVMASLSVVVQQPSAMVRAMALVDMKHFGIAPIARGIVRTVIPKKHKTLWAEVKKYAPVAIIKEMGRFDTNMGRSVQDFVKAKEYKGLGKVKGFVTDSEYRDDAISRLPALADEMAWVNIWNAVKRETVAKHKNLRPNSEEFLKVVGERFTEVITKTQVYDSVLSRSANMRAKSTFMNMWTSFMAEPTTSINMLEDALRQGKRGNKKYAAKAIGAVYGSVILNAALVSIVYAMRDDDEDETFLEKYASRLTTELLDGINPITYIPGLKDVWSIAQGFDIERADMSLVADLVDTLQQAVKVISKDTNDMDEEELAKHQKEVADALWGIADNISSLVGLPTKNVRRDINGAINIFETIKNDGEGRKTTAGSLLDEMWEDVKASIPVVGWLPNETKQDKLYDAIVNGDTAYVDRLKSGYKDDKAYETAVRKALRENDPRIREAAEARIDGDIAEYSRIVKAIKAEGNFVQDTIVAAVNAEINALSKNDSSDSSSDKVKSMYKIDDYFMALDGGDEATAYVVKEDLIQTDIDNGKDREEAEESFYGKFTSYIREQYEEGNISDYEAQRMLVNYGDKTEEEATSKVQYWEFKQEYPDYDDLSEEAVTKYYEKVEPHGITVDVYYDYSKQRSKCKGTDNNGDGKTDSGSVKSEVLWVIHSLPLTYAQKDALYYLNGWSAKTIYEAPWH